MSKPRAVDREVDEFFELSDPWEREDFFRLKDESVRPLIMNAIAESDRLNATDLVMLGEPYRTQLIMRAVGDLPGFTANSKMFYLKPTEEGDVIQLEKGSRGRPTRTRFVKVDRPTQMGIKDAIHALLTYGCASDIWNQKDRLVEITEEQFFDYRQSLSEPNKKGKK